MNAYFQAARDNDDISISMLKFWNEEVYVVIKEVAAEEYDYYYLPSPNPERQCVTVSNNLENLSSVNHPKQKMQGNQLINSIGEGAEIVIMYDDGGDYITREQLQWIKEKVEQVQN